MTDNSDEQPDGRLENEPFDESDDSADWPIAHLGRRNDSDDDRDEPDDADGRGRPAHLRAIVITALAVVVVGLVAGIVVFNSSTTPLGRGAATSAEAATQYVAAVNAGDEAAAAKLSCSSFADDARAQARSGADQGIAFRKGKVQAVSKSDAVVVVTETLTLPGGHRHSAPTTLTLTRAGGRWLVCGRAN